MNIVTAPAHVSVFERHEGELKSSLAEADEFEPGHWWIARVFIQVSHRGQGLGSKLLQTLIESCAEQGARFIEVSPGGYDADPVRQRAFYAQNGFQPDPERPGLMVLRVAPKPGNPHRVFPQGAY